MKRVFFLRFFVVFAIAVWCTPSFAADPARQTFAAPGPHTMTSIGALGGVDMTGAAPDTLNIGVAGTQTNVFSYNNPLGTAISTMAISTDAASMSDIVFLGSSNVYGHVGTTGSFFLNISGGAAGETVTFLGTVYGTTLNVGAGTVNFNSGTAFDRVTNTIFGGDGTINLAPNTTVTSILTTTAGAETGTLNLGSGSQWTGAVGGAIGLRAINVVGGSNTAGVSAGITGAVDNYSFNLLTNTLNINGALTLHGTSIINTTLASQTLYGHIIVAAGNASGLGTGLTVKVLVPATTYIPVGTKFYIVQSTSGTGALATVATVVPTNPLYTFSVDTTATAGDATITTDAIPMQASSNPTVPVLQDIDPALNPDLADNILAPLNALSDPVAIDNATAQLAPSTPALAAPLVTFQGIRQFQNLWSSHLDMCSQVIDPNENCQDSDPRSGWWLKGFGYEGHQNARDVSTGYNSRIIGTMIAYDVPLDRNTRAGLGFGYARTKIDGYTFDASIDSDSYQAIAYIGHEQGPWFVNGSASFGWNEYSSMRHIVYPGVDRTAKAEYSGQDYSIFASTGYHFSVQKYTITPIASLQYSRMHLSGYTEKGAGDVNLKVKSQDYDFLESGLGVKAERYFKSRNVTYVPEVHFNWFHELSNPSLEQTAKYTAAGSSSFTTSGLKTADDTFNVGGGLSLLSCACSATTWSLEAVYDYYWTNDSYHANQVMIRLTSRF